MHVVATYDGIDIALSINGEHVTMARACDSPPCGDILYPKIGDDEIQSTTPLVIGAYHNSRVGVSYAHVGAIKSVQIYQSVLTADTIRSRFDIHAKLLDYPVQMQEYWAATHSGQGLMSPTTLQMPAAQSTNMSVYGKFSPEKFYRCQYTSAGDQVSLSEEVTIASIASDHEIRCDAPVFLFGHQATRFVLLELIPPPDVYTPTKWKPVWQRICADRRCGYVPFPDRQPTMSRWDLSLGLHNLDGSPTIFTFTVQSSLYMIDLNTEMLQLVSQVGGTVGSSSATYFNDGGIDYLLTANYWDGKSTHVDSLLYQIDPVSFSLVEVQRIPTEAAYQWAPCPMTGSKLMFVLASFSGETSIYEWDSVVRQLVHLNRIQTKSATSAQCFAWRGNTYLGVTQFFDIDTYSHVVDSLVMRWNVTEFVPFQNFLGTGAREIKFFELGADAFLTIACEMADYTAIYIWSDSSSHFVEHQRLPTNKASASDLFYVNNVPLLAVAQLSDCKTVQSGVVVDTGMCSFVYRWNGTRFIDIPDSDALLSNTAGGQALPAHAEAQKMLHTNLGLPTQGANPRSILITAAFENQIEVQTSCMVDYVETLCLKKSRNVNLEIWVSGWNPLQGVLQGPSALVVSLDGAFLYVAAKESRSITVFEIDADSGHLTYRSPLTTQVNLDFDVSSLAFFECASGGRVYVTSKYPGSLRVFEASATGALNLLQTFEQDRASAVKSVRLMEGLAGASSVSLSGAGSALVVAGYTADALSYFDRSTLDGQLVYVERIKEGENTWKHFPRPIPVVANHTNAATSGCYFKIGASHFVAVAGVAASEGGSVLVWSEDTQDFVAFQTLNQSTGVLYIIHHTFGDEDFLFTSTPMLQETGEQLVSVYRWGMAQQRFDFLDFLGEEDPGGKIKKPSRVSPFTIADKFYVAVAYMTIDGSYEVNSTVFRWVPSHAANALDGFVVHQTISSHFATDVEFLKAGDDHILVIADYLTTEDRVTKSSSTGTHVYSHHLSNACQKDVRSLNTHTYSVWRPHETAGYKRLGDTVSACYNNSVACAIRPTLLVKDGTWLSEPHSYELVLDLDEGSLAFWRPIATAGFVCLGDVLHSNIAPPNTNLIRCVRKDLLMPEEWSAPIWPDFILDSENCTSKIALFELSALNNVVALGGSNSFNPPDVAPRAWVVPEHLKTWSFVDQPHPSSVEMSLAWTSANVYVFDSSSQMFVHRQSISTVGAFDLEAISISALVSSTVSITKTFLAIANRQGQAPYVLSGQEFFDQDPIIYEWISGAKFVEFQRLSGVVSIPADFCSLEDAQCECFDDIAYAPTPQETCDSYTLEGLNFGFCGVDGVCAICRVSCSEECDNGCTEAGLQERNELRLTNVWSNVSTIRGATGFHHFHVDGEDFLAIALSTCDPMDTRDACMNSGLSQPQGMVLQWDGTKFGPLLALAPSPGRTALDVEISHIHDYSLRIPVGAILEWEFMQLPASNKNIRVLMGFSLTSGVVSFEWQHEKVSGLKGVIDATFGVFDSQIFSLSNGLDNAVASFSRTEVKDSLGNVVSNIEFQNSWKEGEAGIYGLAGAHSIDSDTRHSSGETPGTQDLLVKSGRMNHHLVCGDPPLYHYGVAGLQIPSDTFLNSWQHQYGTICHALVFNVTFHSGSTQLLSAPPQLYTNGTLNFRIVDGKIGEATYNASLYKSGCCGGNAAYSLLFAIKVATVNKAPTFVVANISVDEDSTEQILPFASQLSAGAPNEEGQALNWRFSFTNPGLFATPPELQINGSFGLVEFTPGPQAFGSSLVFVELEDDGGINVNDTDSSTVTASALLVGGKMSTQSRFYIHVVSKNDPPTFDLTERTILFVDAGRQTLPGFATGMTAGPSNEATQTISFVLDSVLNAGAANPGGCIVIVNVEKCPTDELCCTPRYFSEEPRLSSDGTLTFNAAPFVSGSLNLYFTLVDDGGHGKGDIYTTTKSAVLIILPANHPPAFTVLTPNITKAVQRLVSTSVARSGFATQITCGSPDEDLIQKISFEVSALTDTRLFSVLPNLALDGTLHFATVPGVTGVARGFVQLSDDGGTVNVGQDTSEALSFEISIYYVNIPPTFKLSSVHVHGVEDQDYTEIFAFATDVSPGAEDEYWQDWTFEISVLASPEDLFEVHPHIDRQGTLRFVPSQNKFGAATINVRLSDNGGVEDGGVDENVDGVQSFAIYIHPQPRISHVVPRLGSARGADRVTIHGSYFETPLGKADSGLPCSKVTAFLGDVPCSETITMSTEMIVCITSPGLGLNSVQVNISNGATMREGALLDAFLQNAVFFAGISRDGSGGYLAFGPGSGLGTGTIEKPSASAQFFANMDPIADKGVRTLANYEGGTYFAGQFLRADLLSVYHIASYNGLELKTLGGGADGAINTLVVLGNLLVVGGGFTLVFQPLLAKSTSGKDAAGILYTGGLAAWNGEEWSTIGDTRLEGIVSSSVVNGSHLYIGGRFNDPERRNNLAVFDGTRWSSICGAADACGVVGGEVNAMVVDGADLYVGGSFISAGGVDAHRIARYDGYHWYSLGMFNGNVNALSMANGNLYAGGEFTRHDGEQRNHVARFRSGKWYSLGEGVGGPVWSLAAMSNCVFAGGAFTSVEGQAAVAGVPFLNAARWCMDPVSGISSWEPVDWSLKEAGTCYAIIQV